MDLKDNTINQQPEQPELPPHIITNYVRYYSLLKESITCDDYIPGLQMNTNIYPGLKITKYYSLATHAVITISDDDDDDKEKKSNGSSKNSKTLKTKGKVINYVFVEPSANEYQDEPVIISDDENSDNEVKAVVLSDTTISKSSNDKDISKSNTIEIL